MEDLGIDKKFLNASQVRPLASVVGSYTYFADGDVLLAKITPCFENGKLGIAAGLNNGIGFGSSEFIVFRPSPSLDKEFLYYFLARPEFRTEGAARMGGAVGQQRVPKEFIESYRIPVPPLPNQKGIVSILNEAFEGIATAKANAEKNFQNARALFESHLQSVFARRGKGWVETTLEDVCQFENGDRGKNYPNREEYVESGIPWINTGHIQPDGTLSQSEMNFISREKYESLRSGKIRSGDLVYCLRGATLGKTALVDPFTEGAVASSLVIIRPSALLDRRFLYYFLTGPIGQGLIKLYANGAAQPNLGAKSVAKYTISFPKLVEQKVIVQGLDGLAAETESLARLYERKLAALDELKKSLLHQAFAGQL
jgi:type I restriction enzyme S subunit